MKRNRFNHNLLLGATLLLTTIAATSCDDANDWSTDGAYDRLFRVTKTSVTPDITDAELTWTTTPKTGYYLIEVSKDSLYDDVAIGASNGSIVYGNDQTITQSPFTLTNLDSATKYFLRIKSMSAGQNESKWAYLDVYSFKTKSENILNTIGADNKGEDFLNLSWTAGATVTHLDYTEIIGMDESKNPILGDTQTLQLTDENRTSGKATITGLKASTSYRVTIYNGTHARGTLTVSTRIQLPEAELTVRIEAGATLTQEMLNSWADKKSVTIRFAESAEYILVGKDEVTGEAAGLSIPNNMSITFFGAEGDTKATLKMSKELLFNGIHGYIRFENLTINDGGAQYLFNQGADATTADISFKNCELNNFARNIVRFKDQKSISVDKISFENCTITNQGSGGYPCIGLDAKEYTVGTIEFTNTTFNTLTNNLIGLYNSSRGCANVNNVNFNNCTLYNCIGSGKYILDAGSETQGPTVSFNKTILSKSNTAALKDGVWTSTSKGIRTKTVTATDTYITADGIFGGNTVKGCIDYAGTSTDLFANPTQGDFSIKDASFPTGVGHQR